MKNVCKDLKEHMLKITIFFLNTTTNKKREETTKKEKLCYICKYEFNNIDKKYWKAQDHCYYTRLFRDVAHLISNLRYIRKKQSSSSFSE